MLKRFPAIFLLIAGIHACYGQTVFRSVEDVWKYADQHSIVIRTAKYELDKSTYAKKQSYSALLPQVNATGSYTDNVSLQATLIPGDFFPGGTPGSYRVLHFGEQFVYGGGIAAQMNVFNLPNIYAAKMARQTELMNVDSVGATRRDVYQQLATQYFSYILMQEAARIADQAALTADSVYQSTNNKFKQGTVNEANVDVAQLNLERAQQTQISSKFQMITARNSLKALLGFSLADSISIDATMASLSGQAPTTPFAEDPTVKLALWHTRLNWTQYQSINAGFLPTVNILYNYTTQRFDNTFEPFEGATGVAGWFPAQYWALQATWPLFTSGGRYFNARRNKLNYDESMDIYENVQKQSAINDENIRLNFQKSAAVFDKAKDVMNLSFDNYSHVSYRYNAGMASIEDRLNAFRDYLDYQNQYLNSLSDMLVQLYQVKLRQQSFLK